MPTIVNSALQVIQNNLNYYEKKFFIIIGLSLEID